MLTKEPVKHGLTADMILDKQSSTDEAGWFRPLTSNRDYQVKALRMKLDNCYLVDNGWFEWVKEILIKVNTFIWRAKQDRIPTSFNLSKCGVNVQSTICCQCREQKKTTDHVLIQCSFAKLVMEWILKW